MQRVTDKMLPADERQPPAHGGGRRIVIQGLRLLVLGVIAFFILRVLIRHGAGLAGYRFQIRPLAFVASVAVLLLYYFCLAELYRRILEALEAPLPFWRSGGIYYYSGLSRYIPGKVWPLLGRVILLKREGISEAIGSASILLETALNMGSALGVFILTFPFWKSHGFPVSPYLILGLLPVGFIILYPKVLTAALNWILRKLKRPQLSGELKYTRMILLAIGYGANWLILGAAFYLFSHAFGFDPSIGFLEITGMFCLAWAAGFLSFLAPAGLVVREGILAALLTLLMPKEWAVLISISSRVWMIIAEVAVAILFMKIGFKKDA